jgi:hypothetical protein
MTTHSTDTKLKVFDFVLPIEDSVEVLFSTLITFLGAIYRHCQFWWVYIWKRNAHLKHVDLFKSQRGYFYFNV